MSSASQMPEQILVTNYWKEFIDGYIFNDLNKSIDLAQANYLVALGAMCYADYFGKLMNGKTGAMKNFKDFVRKYLPQYSPVVDLPYSEVRSGLAHAYFPDNILVIGVTRTSSSGNAIWQDSGKWKIGLRDFIGELKTAADAFKTDLLAGNNLAHFKKVISQSLGPAKISELSAPSASAPTAAPAATTTSSVTVSAPDAASPSSTNVSDEGM